MRIIDKIIAYALWCAASGFAMGQLPIPLELKAVFLLVLAMANSLLALILFGNQE